VEIAREDVKCIELAQIQCLLMLAKSRM